MVIFTLKEEMLLICKLHVDLNKYALRIIFAGITAGAGSRLGPAAAENPDRHVAHGQRRQPRGNQGRGTGIDSRRMRDRAPAHVALLRAEWLSRQIGAEGPFPGY